jgi:excisionase family DNA binding protein
MTEVGGRAPRDFGEMVGQKPNNPGAARPGVRPGEEPAQDAAQDGGLWSIEEVSRYLQVPVSSIYKMTARRSVTAIPHVRIGGRLRFRQQDIDQWLTLLTTSNLEALAKLRQKAIKVTHGDHQQETPRQR